MSGISPLLLRRTTTSGQTDTVEDATDPLDRRSRSPFADAGWLAFAIVAQLVGIGLIIGFVVTLITGPRGFGLVLVAGNVVVCWWFSRGAYLRTSWGRPQPGAEPPWQEPALSERRAVGYIWLGGACLIAAAIAVLWQMSR
jgi:hypothetical protein